MSQCQQWKDQIDDYSLLRKKGGRVAQMEEWKQARAKYEEKFRDRDCRKYGKKIK